MTRLKLLSLLKHYYYASSMIKQEEKEKIKLIITHLLKFLLICNAY